MAVGPGEGSRQGLARQTLAVALRRDHPARLGRVAMGHVDGALGLHETDGADIGPILLVFQRPHAIAEEIPLADAALEPEPAHFLVVTIAFEIAGGAGMGPDRG